MTWRHRRRVARSRGVLLCCRRTSRSAWCRTSASRASTVRCSRTTRRPAWRSVPSSSSRCLTPSPGTVLPWGAAGRPPSLAQRRRAAPTNTNSAPSQLLFAPRTNWSPYLAQRLIAIGPESPSQEGQAERETGSSVDVFCFCFQQRRIGVSGHLRETIAGVSVTNLIQSGVNGLRASNRRSF